MRIIFHIALTSLLKLSLFSFFILFSDYYRYMYISFLKKLLYYYFYIILLDKQDINETF